MLHSLYFDMQHDYFHWDGSFEYPQQLSHNLWKPALMTMSSKFSYLHILNLQSVMKLSDKFYEVISIIHGNMVFWNHTLSKLLIRQHQKGHDVTNEIKVNFLICEFIGCMKSMLFLANIPFYYPQHVCNKIRFCREFAWSKNNWPYFKNSDSC